MHRQREKKINYINKKEESLSNVYNFKNDFNLDLKSSRLLHSLGVYLSLQQWWDHCLWKM